MTPVTSTNAPNPPQSPRIDDFGPADYKRPNGGGSPRRRDFLCPGRLRSIAAGNQTSTREFMANTKSARKAARKIARRTEINKARRSRMRLSLINI